MSDHESGAIRPWGTGPDPALQRRARESLEARRAFRWHLQAYVIVNAAMVLLWLITGAGHFWPAYLMLTWGMGLAFHALSLRDRDPTPEEIDAEARRLAERARRAGPPGPQDAG